MRPTRRARAEPNANADLALLRQKIGQVNAVQNIVDLLLEQHPHRPNAAVVGGRASLFFDWMTHTVEIKGLQLGSVDDIPDRDFRRRLGQNVSASCAARAGDHAGTPQPQKDLLYVIGREALLPGNFAPVDWPELAALGKVQRAYHAVLGPSGYPHVFTLGIRAG